MRTESTPVLPLHATLEALDAWRRDPSSSTVRGLKEPLERVIAAYGIAGARLSLSSPLLPELTFGIGSLAGDPLADRPGVTRHDLRDVADAPPVGAVWLDAGADEHSATRAASAAAAARAVELAVSAALSRAEAVAATDSLAALDAAVRGIAGVLSVDLVLQLIVDRVRDLSDAEYAALGIADRFGQMERFITSGISDEQKALIGPLPRGHGLLGLIVRENRPIRIEDIGLDERRYGFPPHHPQMHSFLGVPVRSEGRTVGNLYLTNKRRRRNFSESDERLVEMFALHAGIAIENARLHERVQRLAVVEDRHRIGQDLHDGVIQSLYGIALSLEDVPEMMRDETAAAEQRVDHAIDAIHQTIRDIRNFIMGLRPELLDDADLPAGVQALAAEFRLNTMIDLEVRVADDLPDVPVDAATQLLAITREGLSNIARHSGATRASVDVAADRDAVTLAIGDNGRGFELKTAHRGGHGLRNLQSRAEALGGSLLVTTEPGAGTRLEARIRFGSRTATDNRNGGQGDD